MKVYRFESIPLAIPIFLMETGIKNIDKTEEAIFIFFAIKKKTKAKIKTITKMFKQIKDNGGKTTSCMKVKSSFSEP